MAEPPSIPKFASFKPKPKPGSAKSPELPDEKKLLKSTREVRNHGDRRYHHHRRHRNRSRSRERNHHRNDRPVQDPHSPPRSTTPDHVLIVDLIGDSKNLIYGGNHRYDVPPFRRVGAGNVLGAPKTWRIDHDQSNDKFIVLCPRGYHGSREDRDIFAKLVKDRPRLMKVPSEVMNEHPGVEADFVSLRFDKKRKHEHGINKSDSEEDGDGTDYRSIHGKFKATEKSAYNELEYIDNSESDTEDRRTIYLDSVLNSKNIELSRSVEQHPHDIDAWLALIEHQDIILRSGETKKRITNAEIQSTADIKIHMYEKALTNVKSPLHMEKLLLGMMEEGSKIWELQTQSVKWERISEENMGSLSLWKRYIDFRQTTFSTFRFEEIKNLYLKRFRLLVRAAEMRQHDNSLYPQLIYIILRYSIYLRESGYIELSIAIWQALLEFNFFAPAPNGFTYTQKIAMFKEFWESEAPRVGEEGSTGWKGFVANHSDAPDTTTDQVDVVDLQQLFESWALLERRRARVSQRPARTMDDVAEDDPFRVILVSDFEELLVGFTDHKNLLIDAFLLFCGLPVMSQKPASQAWASDSFIIGGSLVTNMKEFADVRHVFEADNEHSRSSLPSAILVQPAQFIVSPESMYSNTWFRSMLPWSEKYESGGGPVHYDWTKNVLRHLSKEYVEEEFGEYHMAFELRNEPETIMKICKNVIKRINPESRRLYNALGLIAWTKGDQERAKAVFSSAVREGSDATPNSGQLTADTIDIWRSWVWRVLSDSGGSDALQLIVGISQGNLNGNSTMPSILKAKDRLATDRDEAFSKGDYFCATLWTELLALLQYSSTTSTEENQSLQQGNITAALAVYSSFSRALQERDQGGSSNHELLFQAEARLLYYHALHGPFRPALLRDRLTNSLKLFPRNTIYLSLYTFNESRLRIENRVRTMLNDIVLTPESDNLVSRFFAIHYELAHGTIHAARAAFEHAVVSPACRGAISLWKSYIFFCAQHFPERAKDIWYQALKSCPWAKELYVVGFETLQTVLSFDDLKATWKVMGEKNLRVHIDLEEIFEEIARKEIRHAPVRKLALK
ncbi:NRDE-2, necessary for RNA interference-domain-containing protein [Calycina marina]|uniref:NRDE-2, necessary for RNA interference-domain-containing protein n=1 Tax=Calycina marina TaxID=1763456 RepID=A0A9P8CGV6_9HELO|nr:NRDE-2, necessary for RNA interference-domain-containing protein [Calycina marina]